MTAVEQFIEQLEKQGDSWENVSIGRIQISIKVEDYLELQRQAKEMEKKQTKDAYDAGVWDVGCRAANFDEYYKRTFKSE